MRSGVRRASVRSRLRCRMISCPAANEIRCVNPSIATVSPWRTSNATASRMVATFDAVTLGDPSVATGSAGDLTVVQRASDRRLRSKADAPHRNLVKGVGKEPEGCRHLGLGDRERGRHPDAGLAAFEDEQAPLEAGPLHLLGVERRVELDTD